MEYDEIDNYVDQLFRDQGEQPSSGEVLSGDWRIDRIDEIIQDTYNEAIWWHNNRISEGTDPRSGLRSLPYVPWDERIDGQAAMMGNAGINESSYERNGGHPRQHATYTNVEPPTQWSEDKDSNGLLWSLITLLVIIGLLLYMALGILFALFPLLAAGLLLIVVLNKAI